MNPSDLTVSIIIVIIFFILYVSNFLVVGYKQVKDNWPVYRCNPIVMPFAGIFGFNAGQNFTYCIQNMQSNYMSYLLQPLNYNMNVLGSVGSQLTESANGVRAMFDKVRTFTQTIVQTFFGALLNFMIEVQRMTLNIKDLFGKIIGAMATLLYTLDGSIKTMNSSWNGPPGQLVRALCFHPSTQVELKDGTLVAMKDIPLNAVLTSGSRVLAVMQISNINDAGEQNEPMYSIKRKSVNASVNAEDIIVSGSHLVYDSEKKTFVHVKDLAAATPNEMQCDTLSCLITTDHVIPIGGFLFHDWEDNNGSASKNL